MIQPGAQPLDIFLPADLNRCSCQPSIGQKLGQRVLTTRMKGMAFQNPFAAQQQAFPKAEFCQGLTGIFGTTGVKTAGMR
jgi:hypothetical protein